ncbi:MAG: phosphodiesterase [Clostridiales bacterium]|nr:phosphodiesterase [Clostridiales bacterium]
MKILVASDLHGSAYYAEKLLERYLKENAEKLILLGDIYNHGPRNQLPKDYNPMQVAQLLNGVKDKLLVVKGNCDSEVDNMISEFSFANDLILLSGNKSVFLTHGHVYNKDNMPKTNFDAMIYGHFHTGFIDRIGQTVVANAGSLSLPKNHTKNSYIILEDDQIILKDIDGNEIDKTKI